MNRKIVASVIIVIIIAAAAVAVSLYALNNNPSPSPAPSSTPTATPTSPTLPSSTPSSGTPTTTAPPGSSTPQPSQTGLPTSTPSGTLTPPPSPTSTTQTPTPITSSTPTSTVAPTPTPTSATPTPTTTAPPGTSATFNFDGGTPAPTLRQPTPFSVTVNGVSAAFSSILDPGGFSVQSQATLFYTLSQFQGNYLYQNSVTKTPLDIRFNSNIKSITFTFATVDYHDPGVNGTASYIRATGHVDSAANPQVATVTTQGTFSADTYPEGTLQLSAPTGQSFNFVRIDLPPLAQGASVFLVDNVAVLTG